MHEYRYPLTRVCLRHGALTLPRTMLDLFPETGDLTAVDTTTDKTFKLTVLGPRSVGGFADYFQEHELEVNDELLIRPLEDGRFAVTAASRHKAAELEVDAAVRQLLDELADANVPVTEAEIRALYPAVPELVDLRSALVADGRFVHHEGRWQLESTLLERAKAAEAEVESAADAERARAAAEVRPEGTAGLVGVAEAAGPVADATAAAAKAVPVDPTTADPRWLDATTGSGATSGGVGDAAESAYGVDAAGAAARQESDGGAAQQGADPTAQQTVQQGALWSAPAAGSQPHMPPPSAAEYGEASFGPGEPASPGSSAGVGAGVGPSPVASGGGTSEPVEASSSGAFPGVLHDGPVERADGGASEPAGAAVRGVREDDAPDIHMTGRARSALNAFGYRVEALGLGQLLATADLGRQHHTVLVRALAYGERLDWAALLSRRRETGATYLAVFGDYRDLHRLQGPADLARATLWSWDGVERARGLSRAVPVSPHDLEQYFQQGGLYDQGLERFERTMAERVAERGEFSEILKRLADMRAPRVFLLEELAGDGGVSRDHVLHVLERLAGAPFHLVARIDQGEFCLRQPVGVALDNFVAYARSVQGHLPNRRRARVTGFSDPNEPFEPEAATGRVKLSSEDAVAAVGALSTVASLATEDLALQVANGDEAYGEPFGTAGDGLGDETGFEPSEEEDPHADLLD